MKLSPLSIPYRAAETTVRLAWIVVIATVGSSRVSSGFGLPAGVGVVAAALLAAGGYQLVYYRQFDYRLTEDTLDIDSGVFSRRAREIPYGRIQNVDVRRNPIQRVLGIAEARVETAGGGETEAQLRYVAADAARELQSELSRRKPTGSGTATPDAGATATATGAEASDDPAQDRRLYAVTPRELALLGLVNVDLRLLSAAAALLPVIVPSVAGRFPLASLFTTAPLLLAGLVALAVVVSSAAGVTAYWSFQLWRSPGELRYERGLLQRYAGTIPLAKVQSVRISANPLGRAAGYASVEVETAGYAPGESGGAEAAVPIAERARALRLAREVESFPEFEFERPPRRARTRYAVRYALALAALAALGVGVARLAPAGLAARLPVPGYAPLALAPLVPVAAHLKWRNLGYATLPDHVVTRAGFWSRTVHVVPYYRVQTVVESATVFQRRRDLATVVIDTAGASGVTSSGPRAIDVDADRATALREEVESRLGATLATRRGKRGGTATGSAPTGGTGGAVTD